MQLQPFPKLSCRICGKTSYLLIDISLPANTQYVEKYLEIANVTFDSGDGLPPYLCRLCTNKLNELHQFKLQCELMQTKLQTLLKTYTKQQQQKSSVVLVDIDTVIQSKRLPETVITSAQDPANNSKSKDSLRFYCDICPNKTFKTKNTLVKHLCNQHKMAKNVYPCPHKKCGRTMTELGLRQHLIIHVAKLKRQKMNRIHRTAELMKRTFVCSYCGKIFKSRIRHSQHQWEHTHPFKHQCKVCGKELRTRAGAAKHDRSHNGEKPFECDICNMKFGQKTHLMYHLRIHSGVKPYKCEFCDLRFYQKHTVNKHTRVHTGERPYKCTFCAKSFATKGNMTTHIRQHTGEKPYKCGTCTETFIDLNAKKRHMAKSHL